MTVAAASRHAHTVNGCPLCGCSSYVAPRSFTHEIDVVLELLFSLSEEASRAPVAPASKSSGLNVKASSSGSRLCFLLAFLGRGQYSVLRYINLGRGPCHTLFATSMKVYALQKSP
jgi:hypothetical protein